MSKIPDTVMDVSSWLVLRNVDDNGENLTQWEIDFVESLTARLLEGRSLTDNQRSRLEQLQEERV